MATNDDLIAANKTGMNGSGGVAQRLNQSQELLKLESLMKQVRDKFINEWNGSQLQSLLAEQEQVYEQQIQKHEATLNSIQVTLKQLQAQKINGKKVEAEQEDQFHSLKRNLEEAKHETDQLLLEKEKEEKRLKRCQEEYLSQKQLIDSQSKVTEQTSKELEKSAQFFRDRLSLQIKKVSGNRLQLVFTCIDDADLSRPFCFCVKLSEDRSYIVTDCDPMVPGLDELLTKLNNTNDFHSFVIKMRKKFQAFV